MDSHRQASGSENKDARRLAQVEFSHASHEQIADGHIECAPEHVDHWRRHSFSGWRREWRRELAPNHAAYEVRNGVDQKYSSEKVSDVCIPRHDFLLTAGLPDHPRQHTSFGL